MRIVVPSSGGTRGNVRACHFLFLENNVAIVFACPSESQWSEEDGLHRKLLRRIGAEFDKDAPPPSSQDIPATANVSHRPNIRYANSRPCVSAIARVPDSILYHVLFQRKQVQVERNGYDQNWPRVGGRAGRASTNKRLLRTHEVANNKVHINVHQRRAAG